MNTRIAKKVAQRQLSNTGRVDTRLYMKSLRKRGMLAWTLLELCRKSPEFVKRLEENSHWLCA